jgi:hypothetical protein
MVLTAGGCDAVGCRACLDEAGEAACPATSDLDEAGEGFWPAESEAAAFAAEEGAADCCAANPVTAAARTAIVSEVFSM